MILIGGETLISAFVGDSRAVLFQKVSPFHLFSGKLKNIYVKKDKKWKILDLTIDHRPDEKSEMARIIKAQGRVASNKGKISVITLIDCNGNPIGPKRVWMKYHDIPGLAMSRSLGDTVASKVGVISEPDIFIRKIEVRDKMIVLASDGLWEIYSNSEVLNFILPFYEKKDPNGATEHLFKNIKFLCNQGGNMDDVTIVVIFLNYE